MTHNMVSSHPAADVQPTSEIQAPPNPYPRRPLQREGARYFLSPAEQAMEDAMLRSSPPPEPVLGKRVHQDDEPQDGNDTEPGEGSSLTASPAPPVPPSISNVAAACQRYAAKKKLRPEQRDEIDVFLLVSNISSTYLSARIYKIGQDSALGQQAKLFMLLIAVENKINAQQSAAPPYTLSEDLKVCIAISFMPSLLNRSIVQTNINSYGVAVMLSVNISAYKGNIPRNHVLVCNLLIIQNLCSFFLQDILKRYRFDLPPGIEHDYANWEKITVFVSYSLTQTRARVKKLVCVLDPSPLFT